MESVRVRPRFELGDRPRELRFPSGTTEPEVTCVARLEPEHDAQQPGLAQPSDDHIVLNASTSGHRPRDAVLGCVDGHARWIQPELRADAVHDRADLRHLAEIDYERLSVIG